METIAGYSSGAGHATLRTEQRRKKKKETATMSLRRKEFFERVRRRRIEVLKTGRKRDSEKKGVRNHPKKF